jgi:hypothetical protein
MLVQIFFEGNKTGRAFGFIPFITTFISVFVIFYHLTLFIMEENIFPFESNEPINPADEEQLRMEKLPPPCLRERGMSRARDTVESMR